MTAQRIRVLRHLGKRPLTLESDGTVIVTEKGRSVRLDREAVAQWVAEGLVRVDDGCVVRTPAGEAHLRRALAGDGDDGFATQHRVMQSETITHAGQRIAVTTNAAECPLAWLAGRKDRAGAPFITAEQYEAGRRLACEHAKGHATERITQSWNASGVRGDAPRDRLAVSEAALDARRRVERALDAVGPGLCDVLLAVCCEEVGLETVEKRQGWPQRSAKVVLRLALDRLADHYGIAAAATGPARATMVRWGAPGYRPRA